MNCPLVLLWLFSEAVYLKSCVSWRLLWDALGSVLLVEMEKKTKNKKTQCNLQMSDLSSRHLSQENH